MAGYTIAGLLVIVVIAASLASEHNMAGYTIAGLLVIGVIAVSLIFLLSRKSSGY